MTRAWLALAVLFALVAVGCADDAKPPLRGPAASGSGSGSSTANAVTSEPRLATWHSVLFTPAIRCGDKAGTTCRLSMDIIGPVGGELHPLVVLLAGGPQPPDGQGYANAAGAPLASRGVVVMRASWRQGARYGGGWRASFRDVACAIGVARRIGPDYGADPDRVTLVGHSLGGWVAAVVGLTRHTFTPGKGQCKRTEGSLRPDAVVTLAGAVDEVRNQGLGAAYLNAFFGGSSAGRPRAWAAADPFALARHEAAPGAVPFTLVRGGHDTVITRSAAPALLRVLRESGYRSRLVEAPSADHNGLLSAPRAVSAVTAATKQAAG